MKFYIRQKVFSLKSRFAVKNELGEDVYTVEGELLHLGARLHICDRQGRELALVSQRLLSLMPRFTVSVGGVETAEIQKKLTLLHPRYEVTPLGWEVSGKVMAHDYRISDDKGELAAIHKAWMNWGDCYEVDIAEREDVLTVLAVVLAIDCVLDAEAAAAASSGSN